MLSKSLKQGVCSTSPQSEHH